MIKELAQFLISLFVFSGILFGIHFYILSQFFSGTLYFPIWGIYLFNGVLVFAVYTVVRYRAQKKSDKLYQLFLGLTMLKMLLAIVFLSPLFFERSEHTQLEVINFFCPYFLFLAFEIFSLNRFLQKS